MMSSESNERTSGHQGHCFTHKLGSSPRGVISSLLACALQLAPIFCYMWACFPSAFWLSATQAST